jgi:hypothetical protein
MDDIQESPAVRRIIDNRTALLDELKSRQAILRDYVRGVALHYSTGAYIYGRPGAAKTYTVRDVLDRQLREPYQYRRGHLTPGGLFELLEEYSESLIILDDLAEIFKSDVALQILLSALEQPTTPDRTRVVQHQRQGKKKQIAFRGGIICISNRELHSGDLLAAFKSRVNVLNYSPSDEQIGAHLLAAAELGWPLGAEKPAIPPDGTKQLARHVIGEMARLGARFDLRLYFAKGIPNYLQWCDDQTESHWKDLVTATIAEHLVEMRHKDEQLSRDQKKASEVAIVRDLLKLYPDSREEQLKEWTRQTHKSSRAFYRRLEEAT